MYDKFRINVPYRFFINSNGTITLTNKTCYLYSLLYNCTNAGSAWGLTVQDNGAASAGPMQAINFPLYVLAALAVSAAPVIILDLENPIPMLNGISIITGGTTPGGLYVWANYSQK